MLVMRCELDECVTLDTTADGVIRIKARPKSRAVQIWIEAPPQVAIDREPAPPAPPLPLVARSEADARRVRAAAAQVALRREAMIEAALACHGCRKAARDRALAMMRSGLMQSSDDPNRVSAEALRLKRLRPDWFESGSPISIIDQRSRSNVEEDPAHARDRCPSPHVA